MVKYKISGQHDMPNISNKGLGDVHGFLKITIVKIGWKEVEKQVTFIRNNFFFIGTYTIHGKSSKLSCIAHLESSKDNIPNHLQT